MRFEYIPGDKRHAVSFCPWATTFQFVMRVCRNATSYEEEEFGYIAFDSMDSRIEWVSKNKHHMFDPNCFSNIVKSKQYEAYIVCREINLFSQTLAA